jgi:hypothetical protein
MPAPEQNRDLTLPPDTYLYLQNVGKGGIINVFKGPTVVNQTGQDQPVRYDAPSRKYHECDLAQAVQYCPRASEGDYVIVENPAIDGSFPGGANTSLRDLKKGSRIVIPGPWCEALYPGQTALVIEGHRLRSNQYLVAMVYNADAAENNWESGTVVKQQTDHAQTEGETQKPQARGLPKPESFAVGTRIVVQGSDVSFFIPCTGVEVLKDSDTGQYVREAVTLEQLEYCCLIDENGKKEYPRGPVVVFPKPTQVFDKDSKQRRKFRPIELNKINGLHLKVTANLRTSIWKAPTRKAGLQRRAKSFSSPATRWRSSILGKSWQSSNTVKGTKSTIRQPFPRAKVAMSSTARPARFGWNVGLGCIWLILAQRFLCGVCSLRKNATCGIPATKKHWPITPIWRGDGRKSLWPQRRDFGR